MAGKERLPDGRMIVRHPSGKVELVGSEQERLALLGSRVLEILESRRTGDLVRDAHGELIQTMEGVAHAIDEAARALGLLDEEGGRS